MRRSPTLSSQSSSSRWTAIRRGTPSTRAASFSTRTSRTRTARPRSTSRRTLSRRAMPRGAVRPRGVDVDDARNFVMVACTDGVRVLDGARDGAPLGVLDTGAGVDNIEYIRGANLLVVAAGKATRLT